MQRVAIEDLEPAAGGQRRLTDALGAADVAINHYRLDPGDGLPSGLHAHADQEEIFVVLAGEAAFETLDRRAVGTGPERESAGDADADGDRANDPRGVDAGGEVTVEAGEAIRFAPGEFQSGRNGGDDPLVLLAIGAPRETEDVRLPTACPTCGREDRRLETGGDRLAFACPDCGDEQVPAPCPDCGAEDLRIERADGGGTVTVCGACGAKFDEPPVE